MSAPEIRVGDPRTSLPFIGSLDDALKTYWPGNGKFDRSAAYIVTAEALHEISEQLHEYRALSFAIERASSRFRADVAPPDGAA